MTIKLFSNLHRNRYGSLYFRIAIPSDLRLYFNRNEIYRSLRTPSVREMQLVPHKLSQSRLNGFLVKSGESMSDNNKTPRDAQNNIQVDLIVKFDGGFNVQLQSEPHDTPDAMQSALATILSSNSAPLKPAAAEDRPTFSLLSDRRDNPSRETDYDLYCPSGGSFSS